jgi:hypothetical protein
VTRLVAVAEPPGGLVPYQAGARWGYADTTGRVLIRPSFAWAGTQQMIFFDQGLALVPQPDAATVAQWVPGRPPDTQPVTRYKLCLLNPRGEFLRVLFTEAAVRQPDGSLVCVPRRQAYGQWELLAVQDWPQGQSTGFSTYAWRRVRPEDDPVPAPPAGLAEATSPTQLAPTRLSWQVGPGGGYLLADLAGHRLTPPRYATIGPFAGNRAVFSRLPSARDAPRNPADPAPRYGYLDTLGREALAPRWQAASAFRHGWAVVTTPARQDAVIDAQGRYLRPPSALTLLEPDLAGYIRQAIPVPGHADQFQYRYLAPAGQPGFEQLTFDQAGPFHQSRAWVRQGRRQGLIDQQGRWVTPLAYDWLLTPPALHLPEDPGDQLASGERHADDAWDQPPAVPTDQYAPFTEPQPFRPLPDRAYLLALRAGRVGVVARGTGREVVAATYESVLAAPWHGVVALGRDTAEYVVALSTGRAVAGHYEGITFATPHGRRLYLTRAHPAAWALLDTAGQLRTAWLPGAGYPTPQGWLLSREPRGWTLRDSTGRLAYASPTRIAQPVGDARWQRVQETRPTSTRPNDWPVWELPLPAPSPDARAAFFVRDSATARLRVLDARLQELGQLPAPNAATGHLCVLPSGWAFLAPASYRPERAQFPTDLPSEARLYSDQGRPLALPPAGTQWAYFPRFDYPRAWARYGVLPTSRGYVTRGGRKLWR